MEEFPMTISGKVQISYVSPADYNADGKMDVLLGGLDQNGQNWLHLHKKAAWFLRLA